jgi:hypothetical protein
MIEINQLRRTSAQPRRSTSSLICMRTHVSLSLIFSAVGVCGCIPYHYTLQPGVTGVVIDDGNSAPVPNAVIAVTSRDLSRHTGNLLLATDAEGRFHVAPKQRWGIYVVPMDTFGPWTEASISAPGYETKVFKLSADAMGPKAVALGEVRLGRTE